jgi:2-polyprenyl-3-methyl-5-hydroxy-6-metoxy-1,4-benzoquinol methylase
MTTNSSKQSQVTEFERIDRVRSFFDVPENYLDRKRFDIRLRAETTQTYLQGRTFHKIIDIGCGDGSVSLPLLTADRDLTLVDLSPNMLSLAKAKVPADLAANVKFYQDDLLNVSLEHGTYDVVVCMGVLAHVASPQKTIQRAADLLKPGGTLVLECTDSSHFLRRLTSIQGRIMAKIHRIGYSLSELTGPSVVRMAEHSGLKLQGTFRYAWPLPGMQRIFSQNTLYHMVRNVFGESARNRNSWLGYEYIFCFRKG